MRPDAYWVVIISYREWVTWTACGALRISEGRRTKCKPDEHELSPEAFEKLMDKAPDVSRGEDQAYLVAFLSRTPNKCKNSKFTDLRLVTGFHPLSARGHSLLKGDAERALVKLGDPVYENRWRDWVEANRKASRETSARRLVETFGLPEYEKKATVDLDVLLNPRTTLRNKAAGAEAEGFEKKMKRGNRLTRQPAYGWWLALTVFKASMPKEAADAFTVKATAFFDKDFDELQSVNRFTRPVTSWDTATDFAHTVGDIFPEPPNTYLHMMAVIYHYQHAIEEFGMIEYSALHEDLRFLESTSGEHGSELASLAAWCIGWHLDNATAMALHCAAIPSKASAVMNLDQVPCIPPIYGQQEMCRNTLASDKFESQN